MDPNPPPGRVLGRSVPRLEDRPLLAGRGQFVGDIAFPHQLHKRVVRSPYAHAALRAVDIAAALRRRVSSPSGPVQILPICRRSTFAIRQPMHYGPTASRCWRGIGCATSASRSLWCSRRTRISPRTQRISSRSIPIS
jgi:hypothetical protein